MLKLALKALPIATTLGLCACSSSSLHAIPPEQMSCTELAREIGRAQQAKEDADADSLLGTVGALLADNKADQTAYTVDGLVGDITSASADNTLKKLNAIFHRNGCR